MYCCYFYSLDLVATDFSIFFNFFFFLHLKSSWRAQKSSLRIAFNYRENISLQPHYHVITNADFGIMNFLSYIKIPFNLWKLNLEQLNGSRFTFSINALFSFLSRFFEKATTYGFQVGFPCFGCLCCCHGYSNAQDQRKEMETPCEKYKN